MASRTAKTSRPAARDRSRPARRGRPSLPSRKAAMTPARPSAGYAYPPGAHTIVADPEPQPDPEF